MSNQENLKTVPSAIAEDFEEQVGLLETLAQIQELTLMGMAVDDLSSMPRQKAENIACLFSIVRTKIMRKEIGFYLSKE